MTYEDLGVAKNEWVPACGGTETPFTKNGYRLLYVWNAAKEKHAYLDLGTDMVLTDEEIRNIFRD